MPHEGRRGLLWADYAHPGEQEADEEESTALAGALCALAEAHMHASDVEQAGSQVDTKLDDQIVHL